MLINKKFATIVLTLHIMLTALIPAHAQVVTSLTECEKLYGQKRYTEAGNRLESLIKMQPANAAAHYLLGNVMVEQNRRAEAVAEYESAIKLDRQGAVTNYCRSALTAISRATDSAARVMPNQDGPQQSQPASEKSTLQQSVSNISQEANATSFAESQAYAGRVKDLNADGEREVQRLQRELQERSDELRAGCATNRAGAPIITQEVQGQINSLNREYQLKIERARVLTQGKIFDVHRFYDARKRSVEESAVSVEQSYSKAGAVDAKVKMTPVGTDLYTHSYRTFGEPSGNAMPIAAPPQKVLGH